MPVCSADCLLAACCRTIKNRHTSCTAASYRAGKSEIKATKALVSLVGRRIDELDIVVWPVLHGLSSDITV